MARVRERESRSVRIDRMNADDSHVQFTEWRAVWNIMVRSWLRGDANLYVPLGFNRHHLVIAPPMIA